jgi:acyl carrier protein
MTHEQRSTAIALMAQATYSNPVDFSIHIPFKSYGVDSLDLLSIVQSIEIAFNIKIEDSVLADIKSGNDVIKYLEGVL